jgi:hypothetical protein
MAGKFGLRFRLPRKSQICNMGFTSPPKEGMLWIFSPEKFDPAILGTRGQHANHYITEAAADR